MQTPEAQLANARETKQQYVYYTQSKHFKDLHEKVNREKPGIFTCEAKTLKKANWKKFQKFHSNCVNKETRASCVDPIDARCHDLCKALMHYCQKHARDPNFLEANIDEEFNVDETPYFFPSRYGSEDDNDDNSESAEETLSFSGGDLNLPEKLRRCDCRMCSTGTTWLDILGGYIESKPHHFLMKYCLCQKIEHPDLQLSSDKNPCKLHTWKCGMGTCDECSIESKLPWDCPVFKFNTDKVHVWVWEKNGVDSGERTKKVTKRISDLLTELRDAIEAYIPHKVHADYLTRQR